MSVKASVEMLIFKHFMTHQQRLMIDVLMNSHLLIEFDKVVYF